MLQVSTLIQSLHHSVKFGLMVIDPDIMPDNTAFILDLAYIQPVFTNIPGYGTVFVRDIDQDANARIGKAIYMEMDSSSDLLHITAKFKQLVNNLTLKIRVELHLHPFLLL